VQEIVARVDDISLRFILDNSLRKSSDDSLCWVTCCGA
jgi:hypothetical protein